MLAYGLDYNCGFDFSLAAAFFARCLMKSIPLQ